MLNRALQLNGFNDQSHIQATYLDEDFRIQRIYRINRTQTFRLLNRPLAASECYPRPVQASS